MADLSDDAPVVSGDEDLVIMPRRHKADEADMDVTPMIDITFLLLIFFLVASRIQQASTAELPRAHYGEGVTTKTAAVLTVLRGPGEQALVFGGDSVADEQRFQARDLAQQERDIAAYVEKKYAGDPPGSRPKEHVLIKAARDVRSREVARIARAVSRAQTTRKIQLYVAVYEEDR